MSYLNDLVLAKVRSFAAVADAAAFFEVQEGTITKWETGLKPASLDAIERVFDVNSIAAPVAKSQEAVWEGKSVCILTPSYKTSNPRTTFALMSLLDRQKMAVLLDFGDAFIAHSRNKLADTFLKTKIEWALTVDDDVIIPFGNPQLYKSFTRFDFSDFFAGMHAINRLLSHGKTLVGALYFGRWAHGRPMYAEGSADKQEEAYARKAPHDICKPTRWVGTGCMLIHRSVFLDIEKKFPALARNVSGDYGHFFTSSEHDLKATTTEALAVLNDSTASEASRIAKARTLIERGHEFSRRNSGLGMGEDVVFCVRAQQAGHQPHVDMGLVAGHVGEFVYGPNNAKAFV